MDESTTQVGEGRFTPFDITAGDNSAVLHKLDEILKKLSRRLGLRYGV